jgi:hypothetical protein
MTGCDAIAGVIETGVDAVPVAGVVAAPIAGCADVAAPVALVAPLLGVVDDGAVVVAAAPAAPELGMVVVPSG